MSLFTLLSQLLIQHAFKYIVQLSPRRSAFVCVFEWYVMLFKLKWWCSKMQILFIHEHSFTILWVFFNILNTEMMFWKMFVGLCRITFYNPKYAAFLIDLLYKSIPLMSDFMYLFFSDTIFHIINSIKHPEWNLI